MVRENADISSTPLTIPNHFTLKGSTLRTICSQAGIPREDFLQAFEESKRSASRPRYILDEPPGLHSDDIKKLLRVLDRPVGAATRLWRSSTTWT